jgi:shikimate dehydrogenase
MNRVLPPSAGVIGWPVAHSKSPRIHRFWLEKLGIDGDYGRFPVHPDALATAIRALPALGLRGINVTVPHKLAVMDHLDRLSPAATAVGAVNTVIVEGDGTLFGTNSDVDGIVEPLRNAGLQGKKVVIAGTGGAARAALAAMQALKTGEITLLARDSGKAEALLMAMNITHARVSSFERAALAGDSALFFNATTLGMTGNPPLPVDLAGYSRTMTVFDAVYAPLETPLLADARRLGMPAVDGLAMLVGQAATAFALFYGAAAPRQHDETLRKLLLA